MEGVGGKREGEGMKEEMKMCNESVPTHRKKSKHYVFKTCAKQSRDD